MPRVTHADSPDADSPDADSPDFDCLGADCLGAVEFDTGPLAAAAASLVGDDAPGGDAPGGDAPGGDPPPGAIVAVSIDDRVHYATAGVAQRADVGGDIPVAMTWAARTDAGSVTKIVATVASLMALVDSGQVDVDDPVSRYLPAFNARETDTRVTTVRDLLEHRAGLWEWWPLYLSGARAEEAIAAAVALPRRYPRGEGRHYSDIGFILLGALVAHVAAEPLADAVRHLALEPFGLGQTRYATPVPGGPIAASSGGDAIERAMVDSGVPYPVGGSSRDFSGWRTHVLVGEVNDGNAFHAFGGAAGHAGLFTTAGDLLTFARGVLASCQSEGPVRPETARQFVAAGADPGQALGFRIWRDDRAGGEVTGGSPDGAAAIGHTGFPGVAFAMLPDREAAAVMVTNRLHTRGTPRATEPMWHLARAAAGNHLDQYGNP
jgi:CubicO group peptidase (beta-lactamase class C family)